ncbi:MAG: YceI family protein [Methyloprofundus sp.]|nr:YceI family protein [Methyloprofundus sp.]MDT8425046.1 YceI family protein [Methyloprofundus sp.]
MRNIIFFSLLVLSQSVFADWALDKSNSVLNFTTTKNTSKTEVQSFNAMQGDIKGNQATLIIDLSSVDTGIEIRDERLRTLFFNISKFPEATASLKIDSEAIKAIKLGYSQEMELYAVIDLYGVKQTLPVVVQVTQLKEGKLLVYSKQPLIVDLSKFNLLEGVNTLRNIAKLQSINAAVPVTFSLLFMKK